MQYTPTEAEKTILLAWVGAANPTPEQASADHSGLEAQGLLIKDTETGEYTPTEAGLQAGVWLAGEQMPVDIKALMSILSQATPGPWKNEDTTVYALNEKGTNRMYASVQHGLSEDKPTGKQELEATAALMGQAKALAYWGLRQAAVLEDIRTLAQSWANAEKDVSGSGSYLATRAFGQAVLNILEKE